MSKFYTPILVLTLFFSVALINIYGQSNRYRFGSFNSGTQDFIEISYGIGDLKHKILNSEFNPLAQNEIIFGRRSINPIANGRLIKFSDNYLFSSLVDDYQDDSDNNVKINYNIWRFGLGYRKGYGYKFGELAFLPYYHMGLTWNKMDLSLPREDNSFISNDDLAILRHYEDQIKFGTSNIAGFSIRISALFSAGASFETSSIFPYHKFWKQFGSFFIETVSQTGIDFLTEGVLIKAVPALTPVIYFILKNGLSYYFYTLKQDEMNWPFETPAPLTMETFKVNLQISL